LCGTKQVYRSEVERTARVTVRSATMCGAVRV